MRQGSLWTLIGQNLRRAPLRVALLLLLMVAGLTGRTLYTYFFHQLLLQASSAGEMRPLPLFAVTPEDTSVTNLLYRSSQRKLVTTTALEGTLFRVYTAAGQWDALAVDGAALQASFPNSLALQGHLPRSHSEVALPESLATIMGLTLDDSFLVSADPALTDWQALRVVGLFTVAPATMLPAALLERPLMLPLPEMIPNLALVTEITAGSTSLRRWRAITTPEQLAADFNWVYVDEHPLPSAGFWAYPRQGFALPGTWARDTTSTLAAQIYGASHNVLALGYAFIGLGVYSVLIIALLQRRREVAIYKTIGISPRQLLLIFGLEVLVISLAAFAVGSVCILWLSQQIAALMDLDPGVDLGVILQSLAAGATVVVLAAAIPVGMAVTATVNQLLHNQKMYLFHQQIKLKSAGEE